MQIKLELIYMAIVKVCNDVFNEFLLLSFIKNPESSCRLTLKGFGLCMIS